MDFDGLNLIRSIKDYSAQKNLPIADVLKVVQDVIQESEIQKYKYDKINVKISNSGKVDIKRKLRVVCDNDISGGFDEEGYQLIAMQDALKISDNLVEGDFVEEDIPQLSLLRFETIVAKRSLFSALNNLVRHKQYDDFVHRIGEIATFSVLSIEQGNLILSANNAETIIYRNKLIKGEIYRTGDHIKVYVEDVVRVDRGPQIIVSRTHKNFVAQLFRQEIPEIYEGIIEVKDVARYPGVRSKVSVYSSDQSVDAMGACIGIRGVRIAPIISELRDERIDVVYYSHDIIKYATNALGEKNVEKVLVDDENKKLEVVVSEEKISILIGRQGQNINLASILIGWKINILSNKEESERVMTEFGDQTDRLTEALDIERIMAQLLVLEGYTSLESLYKASVADLISIEGFDEEIAEELITRTRDYMKENGLANDEDESKELLISEEMKHLSSEMVKILHENDIFTVNQLADLASDELIEIIDDKLNEEERNKIIIDARVLLGWI